MDVLVFKNQYKIPKQRKTTLQKGFKLFQDRVRRDKTLFSKERANSDNPSTPVIPRTTQNIDARPDNMLLRDKVNMIQDSMAGINKQVLSAKS